MRFSSEFLLWKFSTCDMNPLTAFAISYHECSWIILWTSRWYFSYWGLTPFAGMFQDARLWNARDGLTKPCEAKRTKDDGHSWIKPLLPQEVHRWPRLLKHTQTNVPLHVFVLFLRQMAFHWYMCIPSLYSFLSNRDFFVILYIQWARRHVCLFLFWRNNTVDPL